MTTGSEMELIITVADHVALRKSLTLYNKKRRGKPDLPVHDFRLRRLFGYAMRPNADDKFAKLIGSQNDLCHATLDVMEDTKTMIELVFVYREMLFERFGLTTMDIQDLILDVRRLIVEFVWSDVYDNN